MPRRSRLGWLGPAIVGVGIAVACLAGWYVMHARPEAGDVLDTVTIDAESQFVIRREAGGGERDFVELHRGGQLIWQALVPPYAGRPGAPGLAWNAIAVSIRVVRDGRAEVFALSMSNASKLGGFRLAPGHGSVVAQATGPVTLTDHVRSYEIVAGTGWSQLVAFELSTGEAVWKQELGASPVLDGGVTNGTVWLRQATGRRTFRGTDGSDVSPASLR